MMILLSYLGLLAFGAVAFFFTHYVGHRLAHVKLRAWRLFYTAHVGEKAHKGHHLIYFPASFKTARYFPIAYRNAIDVAMAIPWTLGLYFILPQRYFWAVFCEGLLLGIAFSYIHASTHLTAHFFNRFRWYQKMKIKHLMHHDSMHHNFGFGIDWFDKLFGTFKAPPAAPKLHTS